MAFIDFGAILGNLTTNMTSNATKALSRLTNNSNDFLAQLTKMMMNKRVFQKWNYEYLYHLIGTIGILILVLNSYIISLFIRVKALRNKSNIFPINLTLSDTLVGYVVVPMFVIGEASMDDTTYGGYIRAKRVQHISRVILMFSSLVNIYSLAAIVTNRSIAIAFPLKHRQNFTRLKALIAISIIWLLSAAFAAVSFKIYAPLYEDHETNNIFDFVVIVIVLTAKILKYRVYQDVFLWLCIGGAAVASIGIAATFIVIQRRKRKSKIRRNATNAQKRREETKANVMLLLMFVAVTIWIAPTIQWKKLGRRKEAYVAIFLGRFCLSIINPVLYTLLKQDIRNAAWKDWKYAKKLAVKNCKCVKGQSVDISDKMRNRSGLNSARSEISLMSIIEVPNFTRTAQDSKATLAIINNNSFAV